MTGARRTRWAVRTVALLVGLVAMAGCQDIFFEDPAPANAGIALDLRLAPPAPANKQILAQVEYDQVRVTLFDQSQTVIGQETVDITSPGSEARVQFELQLEEDTGTYLVTVELLNEERIVGSGSAAVQVERGSTTPVAVDIDPEGRVVLLPEQREGQTRIVLTWGITPSDLDSHFLGPDGEGGTFHLYYSTRYQYTLDQPPYVILDTDDTSSYGPETITMGQQFEGTYCYYVYQFSSTGLMTESEANVKVYQDNTLVGSYDVPLDGQGRYWTVFTLNGDTLTPINELDSTTSCQ